MMRKVGIDTLKGREFATFLLAVGKLRAALPNEGFIHMELLRDDTGKLCEIRIKNGDSSRSKTLAAVPISARGRPGKVR
jgi:hypothetical protein